MTLFFRQKKVTVPIEEPERPVRYGAISAGGSKNAKTSVETVDADADYLEKLEEQKRLRELLIKKKELRRSQVCVAFF